LFKSMLETGFALSALAFRPVIDIAAADGSRGPLADFSLPTFHWHRSGFGRFFCIRSSP
jgi:hypothetical protein